MNKLSGVETVKTYMKAQQTVAVLGSDVWNFLVEKKMRERLDSGLSPLFTLLC